LSSNQELAPRKNHKRFLDINFTLMCFQPYCRFLCNYNNRTQAHPGNAYNVMITIFGDFGFLAKIAMNKKF
jgi:hypothetical protein